MIAAALGWATQSLPAGFRTLEIGCGTGNVLRLLEKLSGAEKVVGIDRFAGRLRYARQRTQCALVQGDMHAPPFQTQFHLIGMFDVIEHFADERPALRDARALLAPGGKLLLTVPALMGLWSYADEFAGHQRRYDRRQLTEKLMAAGFSVDYVSYFMATTYPMMWLKRRATSWSHQTHSPGKPAISSSPSCRRADRERYPALARWEGSGPDRVPAGAAFWDFAAGGCDAPRGVMPMARSRRPNPCHCRFKLARRVNFPTVLRKWGTIGQSNQGPSAPSLTTYPPLRFQISLPAG